MRKYSKIIISILLCSSLIISCGATKNEDANHEKQTFRLLYPSELTSLNYLTTSDAINYRIIANVVDGLVETDQYGNIIPSLAESWVSNEDNTEWTFTIRKGVQWIDYEGKEVAEVKAQDWVTSAQYVNDANNESRTQYLHSGIVKNAEEYNSQEQAKIDARLAVQDNKASSEEEYYKENDIDPATFTLEPEDIGVKATDDYTLVYTLEKPTPYFLSVLSYGSFMPVNTEFLEAQGEDFAISNENLLYNGGYRLSVYLPQDQRILVKNDSYWDKDNIYIDVIEHKYNAEAAKIGPTMFLRNEIDQTIIGPDILSEWLSDNEKKDLVHANMPDRSYSYFYGFNFEPRFDAEFEPDNWIKAVNNESFRQSLKYALDRVKALSVQDPKDPGRLVNNSITPRFYTSNNGKDYTDFEALKDISVNYDSLDTTQALEYKEKAMEELKAAGAHFPIKMLSPYNPSGATWDKEVQVVKQQLESILGTDYIDIVVQAGAATGFLSEVRRPGKYAFMKLNWGGDYADPETWIQPFTAKRNTYIFLAQDDQYEIAGQPTNNKLEETQKIAQEYYELVEAAKKEVVDVDKRFEAFAKAERFLIDHAIVIPFSVDSDGYLATRINILEKQYAPYGYPPYRYKYVKILEKPMTEAEFNEAVKNWEEKRKEMLK